MEKELTTIQQNILAYILEERSKGLLPTLKEIAHKFNYKNRSTVQQHLEAIERKGYIKRNPKLARNIEVLIEENSFISKPILGEVAAGQPLVIYPTEIDTIQLPALSNIPKESFLLRVKGDSLKDVFIFSGDLIVVNPKMEAADGKIVAVVLEDAALVKRYYKRNNIIELHSENQEYKPILIDLNYEKLQIVGVVVGVYRTMEQNKW